MPCSSQQVAQRAQERDGRRDIAAFAEDGLDHDRADHRRRDDRAQERSKDVQARPRSGLVVAVELRVGGRIRREIDARQQRLVAGPVVEVRGRDARRAERPAVEATAEGDDPGPSGHSPRELQRAVDRLRAGVEEHDRVERVAGTSPPGRVASSRDRRGEADRVDRPDQPVDLGVDRRRDPRMRVAERGDRDAVGEVQVGPAVRVEQPMALAVAPVAHEVAAEDGRQVRGAVLHRPRVPRHVASRPDAAADPVQPRTMPPWSTSP